MDRLDGEYAENADRKDFLPSEIDAIRRALLPKEQEAAKERQGTRSDLVETFHEVENAGKTRDKIGNFAGVSGRTVEKIARVVEAAEQEPERFGHLVAEMDRTGKVNGTFRKLRMAANEARVQSLKVAPGRYRTLIIDPPWDYDWLSLAGRAAPGYATMSHEELLALPVAEWAEDNAHLYLWTTNNFLPRAAELMARWRRAVTTVASRLVLTQRLLPVESQVLALLEIRARQPQFYVVRAKRVLYCVVTLPFRPWRPEIRSTGDAHHQHVVSMQREMRSRSSNDCANRTATQRILRLSVTAFRYPGQGLLSTTEPERHGDLVHIAGGLARGPRLQEMSIDERLSENHLLARMCRQMRSAVLAAEAGERFAPPIEMPDNMREKYITGTGGGAQWRGKRHQSCDGQNGT
ncbi:MAG: MT-A70 family methyltransferase [Beijerinckiaceae bacterium]